VRDQPSHPYRTTRKNYGFIYFNLYVLGYRARGHNIPNCSPNLICSSWMCDLDIRAALSPLHAVYILLSKLISSAYTPTFIFCLCVYFTLPHTFTPRTTPDKPHICGYVHMFWWSICYLCQTVAILFFCISQHNNLCKRMAYFMKIYLYRNY
jgi:hypothetical protein